MELMILACLLQMGHSICMSRDYLALERVVVGDGCGLLVCYFFLRVHHRNSFLGCTCADIFFIHLYVQPSLSQEPLRVRMNNVFKRGDIIFSSGKWFGARIIRCATKQQYNHVAIVLDVYNNNTLYVCESIPNLEHIPDERTGNVFGGVQIKRINAGEFCKYSTYMDVFHYSLTDEQHQRAVDFVNKHYGAMPL